MQSATTSSYEPPGIVPWFREFLSRELSPYPGRGVTVARMVISATITMLIIMTFRIPGGAIGTLYAFLISRDNLRSTFRSGLAMAISYTLGVVFVLAGADIFADQQSMRIAWFAGTMFVTFFVLRTLQYSDISTGFAVLLVNALPVWQIPATAEYRVELTLWQVLSAVIGTAVTITIEIIFRAIQPKNELSQGIHDRIESVAAFLESSDHGADHERVRETLAMYSIIGTSGLRRYIGKSTYIALNDEAVSTVVAMVGRIVDLAASMTTTESIPEDLTRERLQLLARRLRQIPVWVEHPPQAREHAEVSPVDYSASFAIPQIIELEAAVSFLSQLLAGKDIGTAVNVWRNPQPATPAKQGSVWSLEKDLFLPDAWQNSAHVKWALRGCLAATLCYITYEILDWRGIATSVTTCVITALSTIGTSRQKQLLRIAGATAGGFIFGMGAQILILPYIDSLAAFTILFAVVTTIAAWFATSSSRLSYFGIQLALAFYLIHLQEFKIQTSLTIARDRVVGILFGLFMMWLVFDRFSNSRASDEMVRMFGVNLRTLAILIERAETENRKHALEHIHALREEIRSNYEAVSAQADAVPFEFGHHREEAMTLRQMIRSGQTRLRAIYFLAIASLQHSLFENNSATPVELWDAVRRFNLACAAILNRTADHLDNLAGPALSLDQMEEELQNLVHVVSSAPMDASTRIKAEGLIDMSRQTYELVLALTSGIFNPPRPGLPEKFAHSSHLA